MEDSSPFYTGVAMHPKGMKEHNIESKDFDICTCAAFDYPSDDGGILTSLL